MKKIVSTLAYILILTTITATSLSAQYAVDNVLRKYKNDSGVISMSFEGDLTEYIMDDADPIKSSLEKVDIIVFNEGKDISNSDQKKVSSRLKKDQYDLLIKARNDGQRIDVYGIESGEALKKVYAHIVAEEMNIYFFLTGELYMEDITDLDFEKFAEKFD